MARDNSKPPTPTYTSPGGGIVGSGEMAKLIRDFNWSRTAVGPIERWPQSLTIAVNMILQSPVPLVILWGNDGYTIYNDAYSVIAGTRHPSLLGSKVVEGWPEIADLNRDVMHECLAGKTLSYADQQLTLHHHGSHDEAWFNLNCSPIIGESGKPTGVLAIVEETTDQVVSLREAEQLSAQLQAVIDSLPDGVYLAMQDAPGRIAQINQRGAEVLGYDSPDQVPRDIGELHAQVAMRYNHGKGRRTTAKDSALLNGLLGKSVQRIGVGVYNPITGKRLIIRTAGSPVRDKQGNVIGSVAVNTDLTKLYNLQEKVQKAAIQRRLLREQNEQLTQLNATKDEFIALTSHQLRTPATGVKQYIGMLLQGYVGPLTAEQEECLEKAFESNERQLLVIDEILRVAKLDMGRTTVTKEPCDVVNLVQGIAEEQAATFHEHKLHLVTDFPAVPIMAQIDPIQLHMAIGNLVDNAIKYTPEQRKIWVRVCQDGNSMVTIEVRDQGVGIAEKDLEKLFLKFSRIHNAHSVAVGGSGLGLYWAKRVIELHGGEITVRSKPGRGTTFSVSLPLG